MLDQYQKYAGIVKKQARGNAALEAEYETIASQVRQTKDSTLQVARRHFNAPVDTIEGTVKHASAGGVELAEYPGRLFHFSSVGGSMADLTARILGESNRLTKEQAAKEAEKLHRPGAFRQRIQNPRARAREASPGNPSSLPESARSPGLPLRLHASLRLHAGLCAGLRAGPHFRLRFHLHFRPCFRPRVRVRVRLRPRLRPRPRERPPSSSLSLSSSSSSSILFHCWMLLPCFLCSGRRHPQRR